MAGGGLSRPLKEEEEEEDRRDAERGTSTGKDPAGSGSAGPSWSVGTGSRPLRGNQEAPSQTGGYARCSARKTAFVRAPWVGPPNRASPMRGFGVALGTQERHRRCRSCPPNRASPMRALGIVLGTCGGGTGVVGPGDQTGLRPCVRSQSLSERKSSTGVVGPGDQIGLRPGGRLRSFSERGSGRRGVCRCRQASWCVYRQTGWCHTSARRPVERHARCWTDIQSPGNVGAAHASRPPCLSRTDGSGRAL
jgi:hypothetical protein